MKKFYVIITLICACLFGNAQNVKNLNKLMNNKDITTVYISQASLALMGDEVNGINVSQISDKLEGIYIFTSEKYEAIQQLKNEFDPITNSDKNELLMFINDNETSMKFLGEKARGGYKNMLMVIEENDDEKGNSEYVAILFKGLIPEEFIQNQIKNQNLEKNVKNK
jgi:hypothetical protein